MRPLRSLAIVAVIAPTFGFVNPAFAWWDAGHMQIAYVAYKKLEAPVKDKVDALLRLNPEYGMWTASISDVKTAKMYAFVHAATWADDIKTKEYNHTCDKVDGPAAANINARRTVPFGHSSSMGTSPLCIVSRQPAVSSAQFGGLLHRCNL